MNEPRASTDTSKAAGRVVSTREGTMTTYRMPGPGANSVFGVVVAIFMVTLLCVMAGAAYHLHPNAKTASGSSASGLILGMAAVTALVATSLVLVPFFLAKTKTQLVRLTSDAIEIVNPGSFRSGSWRAALADLRRVRPGSTSSPTSTVSPILIAVSDSIEITTSSGVVQFGKTLSGQEQAFMVSEIVARAPQAAPPESSTGPSDDDIDAADDVVDRTYKNL